MKATIKSISNTVSKRTGGNLHMVIFTCDDNKSRICWIDETNANFARWKNNLVVGYTFDGLSLKGPNLINADSYPKKV